MLAACSCQPKFQRGSHTTPAGHIIDSIYDGINGLRERIREEASTRPASGGHERNIKAFFIMEEVNDGLCSPEAVVAQARSMAERMEVSHG